MDSLRGARMWAKKGAAENPAGMSRLPFPAGGRGGKTRMRFNLGTTYARHTTAALRHHYFVDQ